MISPKHSFDWSGKIPIKKRETSLQKLKTIHSGTAHGVFMWWDLNMDSDGEIVLTCAPRWNLSVDVNDYPWRDHWMQAVYYFPKNPTLNSDQDIILVTCHDDYSLWFDIAATEASIKNEYFPPICTCGLHLTSRQRIGMLNDKSRHSKYIQLLKTSIDDNSICLNLSECSFMGIIAAKLGAKAVICYETHRIYKNTLEEIAIFNDVMHKVHWCSSVEEIKKLSVEHGPISVVLSEPYFITGFLPWNHLKFWYLKNSLKSILSLDVKLSPVSADFFIMAVNFENLWKIRAPVREVEGFNLRPFDDIIQAAIDITDDIIDAQPLWEYPCSALSKPHKFMTLDFSTNPDKIINASGKFSIEKNDICNGLVLWVNWNISDVEGGPVISSGPIECIEIGEKVKWDVYSKQGVYFMKEMPKFSIDQCVAYNINFNAADEYFEYTFMY